MLQIHLSNSLAKVLKQHVEPAVAEDSSALQWYGHYGDVAGRGCIILMELQSRYAMVFCGYSNDQLEFFPDMVQDRLWREVCVITQLDGPLPEQEVSLLSDIALDLSSNQHFQKGTDPSVVAHISQVFDQLRHMVEQEGYPLPREGADAMSFGLQANDMLRKRKGEKDYFVPLEVFRDFWLGLIDVVQNQPSKPSVIKFDDSNEGENIIHVDFKKRKLVP